RPISETARYNTFYIMGHRCGGRNAEQLGVSENSVEMIRKSVELGVNGIEMDVRTSEDNIQFIYHDNDVNLRLTQPSLLIGKIESYTFAELRSFLKLANGEKIPSLKEALEEVLKQPHIKLVWLDCKSEKNDVQMIRNIQKEFMDRAVAMGRELKIMMGIPEEEKFNQVKGLSGFNSILTLCELDLTKVRELNSEFWGSRWTEGIQQDKINEMHSEGRKVISWTLDEPLFIQQYVENANFDGILSNYPPLVAYYHYMQ
ncbi:MAG: glycerophosphodiester phosphodiesterase, partial [Syntrophothermus sp.]